MIYEVRTYTLKPGSVAEFESRFEQRHPYREKYSKLGAFWHTEMGPLNQVIHVWEYEDLNQREEAREAASQDRDLQRLPGGREFVVEQQSEAVIPAPFMHPLGSRDYGTGNIYEMRTYTYEPGGIPEVLMAWEEAIPHREEYSPLAACWYTEFGGLNRFTHVWVYSDLNERARIRAESRQGTHWPPQASVRPVRQENKILMPAAFSPVK
jgi:hypothetical protein